MFADRIKELRKRKKLTQMEFAKQFNVATGTIGMWETGKREPSSNTLIKIAEFFNVSVDYLLGKEEKTPTIDEQMNDIEFALYGEVKDLTDEQKQEILDFVKFKKLQEKFGEK